MVRTKNVLIFFLKMDITPLTLQSAITLLLHYYTHSLRVVSPLLYSVNFQDRKTMDLRFVGVGGNTWKGVELEK